MEKRIISGEAGRSVCGSDGCPGARLAIWGMLVVSDLSAEKHYSGEEVKFAIWSFPRMQTGQCQQLWLQDSETGTVQYDTST